MPRDDDASHREPIRSNAERLAALENVVFKPWKCEDGHTVPSLRRICLDAHRHGQAHAARSRRMTGIVYGVILIVATELIGGMAFLLWAGIKASMGGSP